MYSKGQRVVGSVEAIFPFGVFVRLEDGARAYVRRRELTLSGDLDPGSTFSAGQQIKAVVIELASPGFLMELSVRDTLPNPWEEFARQFKVGDVVTATVKNLSPDRVFVQILPGVDGLVPLKELASWKVEQPEDVVWPGDRVEAVIIHLDASSKRVQLSIRRRLDQLAQVESIAEYLHEKVQAISTPGAESSAEDGSIALDVEGPERIELAGSVLVVEDHDVIREPLVRWLSEQGCLAQGAGTATEALRYCQEQDYGLIMVDLDLPGMDGLSLMGQLKEAGTDAPVAVMSSPELIAERMSALQALGTAEIFPKPLDLKEIRRFLVQLYRGERYGPRPDAVMETAIPEVQLLRELARAMRSSRPLAERLLQGLERIVRETRAEMGIVFHLDSISQTVSIIAQCGDIPMSMEAVYALPDSPVKDIILEGGVVWENRVSSGRTRQFRKLLDLLPFESSIGLPIQATGQTEHALFLFHREADAFSRHRLRDAVAMATLFAAALESQALDKQVQSASRVFLSGRLAAGFGHEVYNKVSGLDLQFDNARADFGRLTLAIPGLSKRPEFQKVQQALEQAAETTTSLKRTVTDFQRLMRTEEDQAVDVNQTVRQAEIQVRPLASRTRIKIRLELDANLPLAVGSSIRLQHVFLNLMLNAVQHMDDKPEDRRVLAISTACRITDDGRWVQARFADTGPGIHRQLWEKIFALGFTTRVGGSGLGLYIARSLMGSMGGQVVLEESLIPLGTTFLVELPAAEK
jgi:signal transduction histidine kinase/DNA-binding response OmpR family regulator/predicted RNA-binding protein with RPS1 domain